MLIKKIQLLVDLFDLKDLNRYIANHLGGHRNSDEIENIKKEISDLKHEKKSLVARYNKKYNTTTEYVNSNKKKNNISTVKVFPIFKENLVKVMYIYPFVIIPLIIGSFYGDPVLFWSLVGVATLVAAIILFILTYRGYKFLNYHFQESAKSDKENVQKEIDECDKRIKKLEKELEARINESNKYDLINEYHESNRKEFETYNKNVDEAIKLLKENIGIVEEYSSYEHLCKYLDYLETKRCDSIEGPFGCIAKYEEEKRSFDFKNHIYERNKNAQDELISMHHSIQTAIKEDEEKILRDGKIPNYGSIAGMKRINKECIDFIEASKKGELESKLDSLLTTFGYEFFFHNYYKAKF